MPSTSDQARAELGAFEHVVLAIAGAVFLFAMLPAVIGGVILLVVVRAIARARRTEPPVWLLPVTAAASTLALLGGMAWFGWDLQQLWHRYDAAQGRLAAGLMERLEGSAEEVSWAAVGGYLAAVLPFGLSGGAVIAAALDLWLRSRKRSALQVRQPRGVELGPVAQRRARDGVQHPIDGLALGHTEKGSVLTISDWELRHHVLVCGATGAGKTSVLVLLLEAVADRCPLVVIDFKANQLLRRVVTALGGVVWTMDGYLRWDALRGDPTCLAGKLLAGEAYGPNAEIFRSSAARYVQWVGRALEWSREERDPQRIAELLQPAQLQRTLRALRASGGSANERAEHIAHLAGQLGQAEREGVSGFAARFGNVVESVAEDALGAGPGALVLEDEIKSERTVLFSLDVAAYQDLAPKLGAWVLLDLVRVAGLLQDQGWGMDPGRACCVVVDEFGALGSEGRHVVPLLQRGREAGLACVLATHGLADLERIGLAVVTQIVQNTGTHVVLRQSSAEDAEGWARILGREQREELSRHLDDRRDLGSGSTRWVRDFRVQPEDLMQLGPGDAVVQVAALGRNKPRLERVRVAQPTDLLSHANQTPRQ
jgi:hypothetical protein